MGLFSWIFEPSAWISLATLTVLEIVLGIDNIIFISIVAGKLPSNQQARARTTGLALALITRILLLLSITTLMRLTWPLFTIFGHEFTCKDLILLGGGLFLIAKSTHEIHKKVEEGAEEKTGRESSSFVGAIVMIVLLDMCFRWTQ